MLALLLSASGCDLFSPRTPEFPVADAGTFLQPDTPDQVVENLRFAIAELNTLNYRRSLAEGFVYRPTASALAREPIWSNWGREQEEQYFSSLVSAARTGSGHSLQLYDATLSALSPSRYVLDANYLLQVQHQRPNVPATVQGSLRFVIVQGADGLWRIAEWSDYEVGADPSWSDLKATFAK